jgi:hypothetical protein
MTHRTASLFQSDFLCFDLKSSSVFLPDLSPWSASSETPNSIKLFDYFFIQSIPTINDT